jgi:hypothetical protein
MIETTGLLYLCLRLAFAAGLLVAVYFRGANLSCQALAIAVRLLLSHVVKVFHIGHVTLVPLHVEGSFLRQQSFRFGFASSQFWQEQLAVLL